MLQRILFTSRTFLKKAQVLTGGLIKCNKFSYHTSSTFQRAAPTSRFFDTRKTRENTIRSSKLRTMKLDSPEFHALFTPEMKTLLGLFKKYDYELRIAGGAVRDLLDNKMPHDLDFATTATPDEMKELFTKEEIRMLHMKGEQHGTVTCRINEKENFEVTTLRIDVVTDGRHAEVEFTRDWQLDALRRDLTINSMFLGFDGTVYDYFNGHKDLMARNIRFVGCAENRIQEDYLRILRYFRFYGRIAVNADSHEKATLEAIQKNMHGLERISGERIWTELKKIMVGRHANSLVSLMMELGMAPYIGFPKVSNTEEFSRIFLGCEDLNPEALTVLPALMDQEQQMQQMNERLKISNNELRLGQFIIQHRNDDFGSNPFTHCQDLYCDVVGKDVQNRTRICELLKYLNLRDTLKEFSEWEAPRFPVSGHKLIENGVPKGPQFAKILKGLRQIWKESRYTLTQEELLDHLEDLKKSL